MEPSERALHVEPLGWLASESTGTSSGLTPVRLARRGRAQSSATLLRRMVTDDRKGLGAVKNRSAQAWPYIGKDLGARELPGADKLSSTFTDFE